VGFAFLNSTLQTKQLGKIKVLKVERDKIKEKKSITTEISQKSPDYYPTVI